MNISLPDDMKAMVEQRVRSGLYANASDYVRDLIREDFAGRWLVTPDIALAIDAGEESGWSDATVEQVFAEARAKFTTE